MGKSVSSENYGRIDDLLEAGVCGLCEAAPVDGDDVFCAPCRLEANDSADVVTDPVERTLSEHGRMEPLCDEDSSMCRCGNNYEGGPGYHRRHLAVEIYKALGINGPEPWEFGPLSPSPDHPVFQETSAASDANEAMTGDSHG